MARWADHLISGIWLSDGPQQRITHVMMHDDNVKKIHKGTKVAIEDIIAMLTQGLSIMTIKWDYTLGSWIKADTVTYEEVNGQSQLRTKRDNVLTDHIDYLIDMQLSAA